MWRRDLQPNPVSEVETRETSAMSTFESERVRALYAWWAEKAAQELHLPRWREFDVIDHPSLLPYLFVVETPEDGNYRFKILGESVIEMLGRNICGESVLAKPESEYGHALYAYYHDIKNRRICMTCRGAITFQDQTRKMFESIDCPMVDEFDHVTRIVGVMDYIY